MARLGSKFKSTTIMIWLVLSLWTVCVSAQYYYCNAYSPDDNEGLYNNVLYKVDIEAKTIVDSLNLEIKGEFVGKMPLILRSANEGVILISLLTSGLSGKNSPALDHLSTFYALVNIAPFSLASVDSLPHKQVTSYRAIFDDSLELGWIDYDTFQGGSFQSKYFCNRANRQLIEIERFNDQGNVVEDSYIGVYKNPVSIGGTDQSKFYYDMYVDSDVNLFAADNADNVIWETHAGDILQSSLIFGYSSDNNSLYLFTLRFKLLSFYPPIESPDSIRNKVDVFDGSTFESIAVFDLDIRDIYLANEMGIMDSINGYLVYYFAKGDGYGQFDPAYLLIFDTRTNEASWLRVGWR